MNKTTIQSYGYHHDALLEPTDAIPARVTAVHRDLFEVVCDAGSGLARLKTGAYRHGESVPTTGDFVLLSWQAGGESLIVKTLPRKTYFSRLDPSSSGHAEQAVAANFDCIFILQPLDRDFNPHSLERYLTLAWQSGAVPAVVLTKADTITEAECAARLLAAERLAVGAGVFAVSAKTKQGLERLRDYATAGKTIVFLGTSGAGKSSLINALAGTDVMATGGVREKDGRGRHTTTHRQLLLLESGVLVIDTPGMRELGMWDVSDGLSQSFADVEQYLGQCKFSDCSHNNEPGCAVRKAIQCGELAPERWESYVKLGTEARYSDDKAGYLRAKKQWGKEIAKYQKQLYGGKK